MLPRMFAIPGWTRPLVVVVLVAASCTEQPNQCPQAEGLILDGVARFSPTHVACDALPRSMALVEPRLVEGDIPSDWPTRPTFTTNGETLRVSIVIEEGTSLYGVGEVAGPLPRNGSITETWTEQPFRESPPEGSAPP